MPEHGIEIQGGFRLDGGLEVVSGHFHFFGGWVELGVCLTELQYLSSLFWMGVGGWEWEDGFLPSVLLSRLRPFFYRYIDFVFGSNFLDLSLAVSKLSLSIALYDLSLWILEVANFLRQFRLLLSGCLELEHS